MKHKFTKTYLDSLGCPPKKLFLYDTQYPALELQASPTGNKTFYLHMRVKGHQAPVRVKLGRYPMCSPDQARKLASEAARALLDGVDINVVRGKAPRVQEGDTFGYWWEKYIRDVELRGGTEATLTQFKGWHRLYLKRSLDHMDIFTINPTVLQNLQQEISPRYVTANRVIDLVRNVYSFLAKRDVFKGKNPAGYVSKFPERAKERYLEESEIGEFLRAAWELRSVKDPYMDVVLMALYTGVRRSCLLAARWDQIDGDIWSVPALQRGNKLKRVVRVPLCSSVRRILIDRREWTLGSPWVFPSDSRVGHVGPNAHKAFRRIREAANGRVRTGLSLHALRHTFITYAKWAGIDSDSLRRLAGHSDNDAHQRYIHLPDDRMLELAERVETEIHKRARWGGTGVQMELGL